MNKGNKILLGILTFVLVCVVGYALFSDNITVTGSATAKGDFDVTATCQAGLDEHFYTLYDLSDMDVSEDGFYNANCSTSGNSVSVSANLDYPGSRRYFTITITNTGTIDAIFPSDYEYDPYQIIKVYNYSDNSLYATYDSNSTTNFWTYGRMYAHFSPIWEGGFDAVKDSAGNYYRATDNFNQNSQELLNNNLLAADPNVGEIYFRLKPGDSMVFAISVEWDEDVTDDSKYSKVTATYTFPFEQIKAGMLTSNPE